MDQPGKRTPNVARIYDYLLGGKDNYTEDREAANQLLAVVPDAAVAAMDNRQFLGRVVEYLTREAGIRQFIDIGTGLPTRDSVHSVAHRIASDSRVAYVDNDPVVVAHANALLGGQPGVSVIEGDLREPGNIVTNAGFLRMIDFNQPVAVLLVAVLHFIRDSEDPAGIVSRLKSAIAPGSYLVISHVTDDHVSSDAAIRVRGLYEQASAPGVARSRRAVTEFFDGLEMVPPGLVSVTQWRPGRLVSEPGRTIFYAGAGMKC